MKVILLLAFCAFCVFSFKKNKKGNNNWVNSKSKCLSIEEDKDLQILQFRQSLFSLKKKKVAIYTKCPFTFLPQAAKSKAASKM